ncbi:molybdenum cofactor cytidylyltransferase [Sulfobacillus sp. hq2]|nr:molybdenum cofactor cytidylyltransferase [Sulfobacillus sp. hq2]
MKFPNVLTKLMGEVDWVSLERKGRPVAMSTTEQPEQRRKPPARVVAVLLAAGLSSRMGRPKYLLPWGRRTVLGHIVETIQAVGMPVVVVHHQVLPKELGVDYVFNPAPERGLSGSLRLGLERVAYRWPGAAAAVFLADQPFITADDIDFVLEGFLCREKTCHAVRPYYNGQVGHPVLLDAEAMGWTRDAQGDAGLGPVLASLAPECRLLRTIEGRPNPAIDIDTPEDYRLAFKLWNGGDKP